jgi:NADPH:quinone reductase-like Zn-dependent oxidoreductase
VVRGGQVLDIWPDGVDGIVDTIVSETSLKDDLAMLKESGRICHAGSLAESYGSSQHADSREALKDARIDFYGSDSLHVEKDGKTLQKIIKRVEEGIYQPNIMRFIPSTD